MLEFGLQELLILFIVMIIFGGRKLPKIGSGLGKGIKNFKDSTCDVQKEIEGVAKREQQFQKESRRYSV
ncbi:MAG: twin-arginine translocase TatA/TatE family subunit [Deltaproteobacteria bacterium]